MSRLERTFSLSCLLLALLAMSTEVSAQATDVDCSGCVDTSDIAGKSVTNGKLGPDSVSTNKLSNGAVTTDKIAGGAVTRAKIDDAAISTGKLANKAVISSKIAPQAVNNNKIADGAVSLDKLAPDVINAMPSMDNCVSANGLVWCFDNNTCGQACNDVCASKGLSPTLRLQPVADDNVWFEAQNTQQECQAISDAFGNTEDVAIDNYTYSCMATDGTEGQTVGGGITGPLLCSTWAGCPANHRAQMDNQSIACGESAASRSICPCELPGLSPAQVPAPN